MMDDALLSGEDKLAAALSHASVALYLIGPLVPLIAWIAQREKSSYLRFQAAQALIFQLIGTVFYFGVSICGALFYIGMLFPTFIFSEAGEPSGVGLAAMMAGIMIMCIFMGVAVLGWPLFVTLGFWAALQSLRGRSYRYPLIGGWVERYFERNERSDQQAMKEVSA